MEPAGQPAKVSQREIAGRLGLSVRTVSLALNGHAGVAQATRDLVRAEAERAGLRARGRRRNAAIGVCVPDLNALNPMEWGNLVIQHAVEQGFAAVIQPTYNRPVEERRAADTFRKLGVEGVILTSSQIGVDFQRQLWHDGIPVVSWATRTARRVPARSEFPCVVVDHYAGAYQAVEHLVADCGLRDVVFLCGPAQSTSAQAKLAGYRDALTEAGCEPAEADPGSYDFRGGYEAAEKLMARRPRPAALFCYSDELALGALRYCHERDIAVPDELAIVGYDDIRIAQYSWPPLTTVHVPRDAFAKLTVRIIAERLWVGRDDPFELEPPYLRVRGTTPRPAHRRSAGGGR
jgi:LacI family transcriptional regulator